MIKFQKSNPHKTTSMSHTNPLLISTTIYLYICCLLTPAAFSHSFINAHNLNNIGGDGENFFEDDIMSGVSLCLPNYEVSEGSIIRTKDSQDLGARFLNESDLGPGGRDECLHLCCRTQHCNVAIFEEKNSGSCYMFDCGSPEDFRCKFTSQIHYMSAILRRREAQVPPNIQQHTNHAPHPNGNNQHEAELNQLRTQMGESDNKGIDNKNNNNIQPSSSNGNVNIGINKKGTTSTVAPLGIMESNSRRCSRWQFECKSSGECIAIYNACDGIPNCDDGSDEGPELHCPSVIGSVNVQPNKGPSSALQPSTALNNGLSSEKAMIINGNNQVVNNNQQPSSSQQDYNSGQVHQQQSLGVNGKDHIFNHKDGGIMDPNYGNQLQQQKHNNPFWKPQPATGYDYGNGEQLPSSGFGQGFPPGQQIPNNQLYPGNVMNNNNYVGNGPAGTYPYNPGYSNPQQPQQQPPSIGILPQSPQYTGQINNNNLANAPQSQYYGNNINPINNNNPASPPNDNSKAQQNPIFLTPSRLTVPIVAPNGQPGSFQMGQSPLTTTTATPIIDSKPIPNSVAISSSSQNDKDASTKVEIDPKTSSVSSATKSNGDGGESKLDSEAKLEDEILKSLKNQPYSSETASVHLEELTPHKAGPGAFLLFILGLGMSIVMAVIVGCRLRRISIGARRRRKNRLDPDYLVDGMYL